MSISEFDEAVINLNILSNLDQNKKLITKETYLNVEVNNFLLPEFLKRWYRGDGRDKSVKKVDEIVRKSLKILNERPEIESYLINSVKGIENLKATYSSDVQTVARLNTIIDKINRKITIDEDTSSETSSNKSKTF